MHFPIYQDCRERLTCSAGPVSFPTSSHRAHTMKPSLPRPKSPAADDDLGAYRQQSVIRGIETVTLPRAAGVQAINIMKKQGRQILCCTYTPHHLPALSLICPMEIKRAAETCRTHEDVMPRHAMPCTLPENSQGMSQYRKKAYRLLPPPTLVGRETPAGVPVCLRTCDQPPGLAGCSSSNLIGRVCHARVSSHLHYITNAWKAAWKACSGSTHSRATLSLLGVPRCSACAVGW